jgi:hypothetical protein
MCVSRKPHNDRRRVLFFLVGNMRKVDDVRFVDEDTVARDSSVLHATSDALDAAWVMKDVVRRAVAEGWVQNQSNNDWLIHVVNEFDREMKRVSAAKERVRNGVRA